MRGLTWEQKRQLEKDIKQLTKRTSVKKNHLDFVRVQSDDPAFELIGRGCSSGVFRYKKLPFVAVKLYSPEHRKEVFLETFAYKQVKGLTYFPRLYLYGPNFLAIEYIEGKSLYECMIEGLEIPEQVIEQVDHAINLAKERGLTPSDVHFKNIIINGDRITLVDLSDYMTAKHVSRWDKLKFFYRIIYRPLLRGVKIPQPVADFIRKFLKKAEGWINPLAKS